MERLTRVTGSHRPLETAMDRKRAGVRVNRAFQYMRQLRRGGFTRAFVTDESGVLVKIVAPEKKKDDGKAGTDQAGKSQETASNQ